MDSLLGPSGLNPVLVGLVPLVLAVVVFLIVSRRDRWACIKHLRCPDKIFAISLGAIVCLSSTCLWFLQYNEPLDTLWDLYYRRAVNLAENGVFGYGAQPTAFFPPGYSFLLVPAILLLGSTKWAVFSTNIMLLVLCTVALRWVLMRLQLSPDAANIVSLFFIAYPTHLFSVYVPATDVPFSLVYLFAFAFLALFACYRQLRTYVIFAGVLAGASALMRSNGLILFAPLAIGFGMVDAARPVDRYVRLAILTLSFVAVVTPWSIRNAKLFEKLIPISTNAGYNLLAGNNPTRGVYGSFFPDTLLAAVGQPTWNEVQRDSFWLHHAAAGIFRDPAMFVRLGVQKVIRVFSSDSHTLGALRVHTNAAGIPAAVIDLLYGVNNFLYYLVGFLVIRLVRKRWVVSNEVRWAFLAVLFCVVASAFVLFGLPRYKEPAGGLTVLMLGIGLTTTACVHQRRSG